MNFSRIVEKKKRNHMFNQLAGLQIPNKGTREKDEGNLMKEDVTYRKIGQLLLRVSVCMCACALQGRETVQPLRSKKKNGTIHVQFAIS